jgi:hypothetical protein
MQDSGGADTPSVMDSPNAHEGRIARLQMIHELLNPGS